MCRRWLACALLLLTAAWPATAADTKDPLVRARALYNEGNYDGALAAADEARKTPAKAQSADLIAARAYLERNRDKLSVNLEDLTLAREHLRRIDPSRFTAVERVEYLAGIGETLFFDDAAGASAVIFESLLAGPAELPVTARDRVLNWWAHALDRDARPRPDIERQGVYQRIRARMAAELARNPGSEAASYWAAAAARGEGDLQGAWDAAQAGWARANLANERETSLRNDLDTLVQRAIVPERARMLARPPETLTAEWERFKAMWQ